MFIVYHHGYYPLDKGLGLATCSFILANSQVYFECFNNVNNALSDAHSALVSDLAKV